MTSSRTTPSQARLAFPIARIFLLGGIAGSGLNVLTILLLHLWLSISIGIAFSIGTLVNLVFHHLYYHLIFLNREITLRTPLWLQGILYLLISAGAGVAGWALHDAASLPIWLTMVLVLGAMAITNAVVNRISTFSSAELAEVEYAGVDEKFYQDQTSTQNVNFIRAWFHGSRFSKLHRFVGEHYRPGMTVADLGCGNCLWNTDKLPVTGVDVNQRMLNWAKSNGYIGEYRVSADLSHTGLPKGAFDIVVMSETLEHLLNLNQTLQEVRSLLKDDGRLLITVPYDFFLGPFFIMFNVNCLYQGYVNGSRYHLYRCGHVNHFTRSRLKASLAVAGFGLESVRVVNGLTLFAVARKV